LPGERGEGGDDEQENAVHEEEIQDSHVLFLSVLEILTYRNPPRVFADGARHTSFAFGVRREGSA
jgi:hypothetical protein